MEEPKAARELIAEIERFCCGKSCIFRGTSQQHDEVSSSLYRKYKFTGEDKEETSSIFTELFQPIHIEKEIVDQARAYYTQTTDIVEILTDLRHFGADTTLIDFSRSLLVALFFACNGDTEKDGELIALSTVDKSSIKVINYGNHGMEISILEPARTAQSRGRVNYQCSVFVHAPKGCIPKDYYELFCVPKALKEACLDYLREFHDIHEATIYNDLLGFIGNQENFESAQIEYYRGSSAYRLKKYHKSRDYCSKAIELKPDYAKAYNNRGLAQASLCHDKEARADYLKAIELAPESATAYYNFGIMEEKLGNMDEARTYYLKALEMEPQPGSPNLVDSIERKLAILNKVD